MNALRSYVGRNQGFTLFEVVLVVAIFGGLIFVIANFMRSSGNLESLIDQKLQVRQDLAHTFQTMVTEIRSMGRSIGGAYPLITAGTSTLLFYSDVNADGLADRVRYFLATSTLEKGVVFPTGNPLNYATNTEVVSTAVEKIVTSSIPSFFEYFDATFTGEEASLIQPVDVQDVRVIRVTVYADLTSRAPRPVLFTNTITVRNLRTN